MQCSERERLWAAYDEALNVFSLRSFELGEAVRTKNFSAALTAAQEANRACLEAREAWQRHLELPAILLPLEALSHGVEEMFQY
jgi:hypothetical protein